MTTDLIEKMPAGQAKTALAAAIDPSTGLDLMTLATVFVQSGFFSSTETVAQGVVKILAGRELGFPAMASVRHIYVHNGHIGLQATLIATKIRQSGTYDYKIVESTDEKCVIEFLRKNGNGEIHVEGRASFTIEEAKRANLVKDKSAWQTYPSDLLFARAMTRGQRRYCPDVFGQTVYSEEEVREIEATEPRSVGSQTIEDRAAEMMPREKVADTPVTDPASVQGNGQPPAEDIPVRPAEEAPVTADANPPEAPAPPVVAGDSGSEAAAGVPAPAKLQFTVGKERFETNGVTRAQLMELFKICPRVGKKCGPEKPRELLIKEFGVEHRVDLTEEQAERYMVRLREMLEG